MLVVPFDDGLSILIIIFCYENGIDHLANEEPKFEANYQIFS